MKLEDQVCSLELAKRLKELGVDEHSLFYWVEGNGLWTLYYDDNNPRTGYSEWISAFTVAELGQMLPGHIKPDLWLTITNSSEVKGGWTCGYQDGPMYRYSMWEEKEADARAKMLIYLIEHGLVKT